MAEALLECGADALAENAHGETAASLMDRALQREQEVCECHRIAKALKLARRAAAEPPA